MDIIAAGALLGLALVATGHAYLYRLLRETNPKQADWRCFVPVLSLYPMARGLGGFSRQKSWWFAAIPLAVTGFMLMSLTIVAPYFLGMMELETLMQWLLPGVVDKTRALVFAFGSIVVKIVAGLGQLAIPITVGWTLYGSTKNITGRSAEALAVAVPVMLTTLLGLGIMLPLAVVPSIYLWYRRPAKTAASTSE